MYIDLKTERIGVVVCQTVSPVLSYPIIYCGTSTKSCSVGGGCIGKRVDVKGSFSFSSSLIKRIY